MTRRWPIKRNPGALASSAAWTRVYRLQDGFSAEQADERTSTVRAEFEQALLLAFDDFGKGHFTAWVMQEYSSLFDYRAMVGLPTFLTTNLSPKQMREQFGDYLIGRMLAHCLVLHVEGADTRFISVLLENPDLSRRAPGHGDGRGGAARRASPAGGWQAERIVATRTPASLFSDVRWGRKSHIPRSAQRGC